MHCIKGTEVESGRTLKQRAYHEMREFLTISLYLWVVLGLFILYRSVILTEYRISFVAHGIALINALALAKVMLVARRINLGEKANSAPLIYPILLKSAIFSVVLAGFKILEDTIVGSYRGESFHRSVAELAGGTWQAILTLTVLLFVILIPLCAFTELQRVFGKGTLEQILFRRAPLVKTTGQSVI